MPISAKKEPFSYASVYADRCYLHLIAYVVGCTTFPFVVPIPSVVEFRLFVFDVGTKEEVCTSFTASLPS